MRLGRNRRSRILDALDGKVENRLLVFGKPGLSFLVAVLNDRLFQVSGCI